MSAVTKSTHAGWHRRGRRDRWRRIVEADGFDRAWAALLSAVEDLPGGGELLVVAINVDPNASGSGPRVPGKAPSVASAASGAAGEGNAP